MLLRQRAMLGHELSNSSRGQLLSPHYRRELIGIAFTLNITAAIAKEKYSPSGEQTSAVLKMKARRVQENDIDKISGP